MNLGDMKNKIIDNIRNDQNFMRHKNLIIVGENTSGKSKLMKDLIKVVKDEIDVYFVDTVNRKVFDTQIKQIKKLEDYNFKDITKSRLDEENFNKKDVFNDETGTELIYNELIENFDLYKDLLYQILSLNLEKEIITIALEENYILRFNGDEINNLSDGIQSMVRILIEVNYASICNCKYVFIDEVDLNLDYKNSFEFIEKIINKYPKIRYIFSCHSVNTILGLDNFDVLKIEKKYHSINENICYIFDSKDLDSLEIIERKLFSFSKDHFNEVDKKISCLLNQLINSDLNKDDILNELNLIQTETLRQNIVVEFIKNKINVKLKV